LALTDAYLSNMNEKEIVLQVFGLCKSFGTLNVLNEFELALHKKEHIVVLGKSGSGKSVLIKCIIGLLKPDKGKINVLGNDMVGITQDALIELRKQVGFLFQSNALYDSMSIKENLEFPLRRHRVKIKDKEVMQLINESLEDVGLAHTLNMMPEELSGGMRKRIALARTLILKPKIILYDEPTTGLDPITAKEIIHLMNEIKKKYDTAALVISHDMNCIKEAGDKIALLWEGKCHRLDTYDTMMKSMDPIITNFFH